MSIDDTSKIPDNSLDHIQNLPQWPTFNSPYFMHQGTYAIEQFTKFTKHNRSAELNSEEVIEICNQMVSSTI